jgi:ribosomal protein S18 acetylase RimI-like enzyme
MQARALHNRMLGKVVTVRLLGDGDTATVAALFERLGPTSRERRFHAAKPRLTCPELDVLARVDGDHHVLVAYVDGDPLPAAMARVARDVQDRRTGEIAFEVADAYQGFGIGSQLLDLLLADARAAGIARADALVQTSNRAALGLLRRGNRCLGASASSFTSLRAFRSRHASRGTGRSSRSAAKPPNSLIVTSAEAQHDRRTPPAAPARPLTRRKGHAKRARLAWQPFPNNRVA